MYFLLAAMTPAEYEAKWSQDLKTGVIVSVVVIALALLFLTVLIGTVAYLSIRFYRNLPPKTGHLSPSRDDRV